MSFENAFKIVFSPAEDFKENEHYLNRKSERLDKEKDQLAYQLYGLKEEEIKFVEEDAK